jgi:hypothetical protein
MRIALNPVRLGLGTFCFDNSDTKIHMMDGSDIYQPLLRIKIEFRIPAVFNT